METEAGADKVKSECLAHMEKVVSLGLETVNVCVCSFSEEGDVLSQWRAYGGKTSGIAVGFSGSFLRKMSEQYGWLVPVVYDREKQRSLVRTLLGDSLDESLKSIREGNSGVSNLFEYLPRYAPILKDHSFVEEKEWRIVTRPLPCTDERFGYRPGGSMLIPYFRLPLAIQEKGSIKEVVVGPTPYPRQSLRAVDGLLTKYDIPTSSLISQDVVTVRSSEIPYRNW